MPCDDGKFEAIAPDKRNANRILAVFLCHGIPKIFVVDQENVAALKYGQKKQNVRVGASLIWW